MTTVCVVKSGITQSSFGLFLSIVLAIRIINDDVNIECQARVMEKVLNSITFFVDEKEKSEKEDKNE